MGKTIFILLVGIIIVAGAIVYLRDDAEGQTVTLYYYNASKDLDAEGILLCSAQGLEPVERTVQSTGSSVIEEAMRLHMQGALTADEKSRGISTEFPIVDLTLASVSLADGVLTLTYEGSLEKTGGGACRVNILRAQVEATAKQFNDAREVRITPETGVHP